MTSGKGEITMLHQTLHSFTRLAPEFVAAWAGWLIHSFVHTSTRRAGRLVRALIRKGK